LNKKLLLALAALLVLGGCASGVKRTPAAANTPASTHAAMSSKNQISAVSIALTEDAKKKQLDNLKFNSGDLLSTVKRALESTSIINETDNKLPTLEILVTDMRTRSAFSAIAFGFMAGADSIDADVIVRDKAGKELDRFTVSTSYALGGIGGGQDSARMSWLYEKFAEETVKELIKP